MIFSHSQFLKLKKRKNSRALNAGSQANAFACRSDIVIYVGDRGVGKTHLILTKALPKISEPKYKVAYLRREIKDSQGVGGIADASKGMFAQFGIYLESIQSMTWKFTSGARAVFLNYSAPLKEFQEAIQGKEYTDAFIDEITHIDEPKFNAVFSNLRNTYGGDTQIFGTCNADPSSWIKGLISWWLDSESGFHIPERDGVTRYFFQFGDSILESVWGDTREEVYELAKSYIDAIWKPEMALYGGSKLDFALSLTVYEGKMYENEQLMKSGGTKYMAKLQKGSMEMKNRYAHACWKKIDAGSALITERDMERMFGNAMQKSGVKYASMDVCGEGNDKAVLWIWDGLHITNVYMTKGLKAKELFEWTQRHLNREKIPECNFIYDAIGVGYSFSGYFNDAKKFISNAKVSDGGLVKSLDGKKIKMYADLKSETIGRFLETLNNHEDTGLCGISIDEELLNTMFFGQTLRQHLLNEIKSIRWAEDRDGVMKSISKKDVKKIIGHSADIILGLIYRFGLELEKKKSEPMEQDQINELHNFFNNY